MHKAGPALASLSLLLYAGLAVGGQAVVSPQPKSTPPPQNRLISQSSGVRYQLSTELVADHARHTIEFVAYDGSNRVLASDKFNIRVGTQIGRIAHPIFKIFGAPDVSSATQTGAVSLVVKVDGLIADRITWDELQARAGDLASIDASLIAFDQGGARSTRATSPDTPTMRRLQVGANTETWQGCNQDTYCYAQWAYCNENCQPWDPYLPCEACNGNLSECTGGTETNDWWEESWSSTFVGYVCEGYVYPPPGNPPPHTDQQFDVTVLHQEFQTWHCSEEDGDHWTTINTSEYTDHFNCYRRVADYCVSGLPVVYQPDCVYE